MRTGRPPKPTALHKLHGTARTTRMAKRAAEPIPVGDLTDAPDWFTPSQRDGWDYAITHSPKGVLKLIDRSALVLWVEAEDSHRGAPVARPRIRLVAPEATAGAQAPDIRANPWQSLQVIRGGKKG
jgi:hypothetical protein